jgi:hypothetical protein
LGQLVIKIYFLKCIFLIYKNNNFYNFIFISVYQNDIKIKKLTKNNKKLKILKNTGGPQQR